MIEKVSPEHPDKIADRIAGAIVDYCYTKNENPKVAVEVLIGHGVCHIIAETSEEIEYEVADNIVKRIAGDIETDLKVVKQDEHLAENQSKEIRCGDNGIFKGVPLTENEKTISSYARRTYDIWPYDGKYILTDDKFIICQSNASNEELKDFTNCLKEKGLEVIINPLGEWTGGTDVDTGATNRKLGSDMAQSVTGGGLHGKDLSKADVSVNIYAFKKAQETGKVVELCCAIGDNTIDGKPYSEIVEIAREYINKVGGFEKFAEWGLY
jgi:S-adenosylmethionine synthetase